MVDVNTAAEHEPGGKAAPSVSAAQSCVTL